MCIFYPHLNTHTFVHSLIRFALLRHFISNFSWNVSIQLVRECESCASFGCVCTEKCAYWIRFEFMISVRARFKCSVCVLFVIYILVYGSVCCCRLNMLLYHMESGMVCSFFMAWIVHGILLCGVWCCCCCVFALKFGTRFVSFIPILRLIEFLLRILHAMEF